MEDFVVLRQSVWRLVEQRVDLSSLDGSEVASFFVKMMQASDWLTERGLEYFDALVRDEMEEAVGQAAATDLLTGLPDRELFNRLLLPRAIENHERLSLAVFDVANFSETVAKGEVDLARDTLADLAFAWRACRAVRSNAIVLARDGATVGVGMGQVNRVDAARLAVARAGAERAAGAVAASDAFFPFPDGLLVLAEAGVRAVVHPGGSVRDAEVTAAAADAGVTVYLTGTRHFAH